jgi:hypothetical protein
MRAALSQALWKGQRNRRHGRCRGRHAGLAQPQEIGGVTMKIVITTLDLAQVATALAILHSVM